MLVPWSKLKRYPLSEHSKRIQRNRDSHSWFTEYVPSELTVTSALHPGLGQLSAPGSWRARFGYAHEDQELFTYLWVAIAIKSNVPHQPLQSYIVTAKRWINIKTH